MCLPFQFRPPTVVLLAIYSRLTFQLVSGISPTFLDLAENRTAPRHDAWYIWLALVWLKYHLVTFLTYDARVRPVISIEFT